MGPSVVGNDLGSRGSPDPGIVVVRVLGGGMVAPDGDVGHLRDLDAGLGGKLGGGPVFVQASHGEPALAGNVGGIVHGDQAIGVAGVPDHQHADVGSGVLLYCPALSGKDLAVDAEQVSPLHPGLAGNASHEQGPVGSPEAFVEVTGGADVLEKRKGAVVQFHDDSLESLHAGLDLDQVEGDGLIRAEDGPGGDAEKKGVADLTGCPSDGYADGRFVVHDGVNGF